MPDREDLPVGAEHDLLVGDQPGQPDRVHPDPVDGGAAGAGQLLRGGVGRRPEPGLGAGLREQCRGAHGRARRGVDLPGVVQLDHLDGVEEPRGLPGELHGQHGTDAEVGGDEDVPGGVGEPAGDGLQPRGVEPAGADDGGDPVVEREPHVVERGAGMGDVDDDLGAGGGQRREVVTPVDLRGQLEVGRGRDGPADLDAHPATGAQHADPDRLAHGPRA